MATRKRLTPVQQSAYADARDLAIAVTAGNTAMRTYLKADAGMSTEYLYAYALGRCAGALALLRQIVDDLTGEPS